jgi:predicted phage tail protein
VPPRLERLPIDWPVTPVDGGVGYRTQLAPNDRFDALLADEVTTSPRVRIGSAPDGRYVLRLRAIDAQGLEGRSSERSIEVFAQPAPPFLIEPASDAQVLAARPLLRWTRARASANYRLQIFRVQAPDTQPVDDQIVLDAFQAAATVDLEPGLYRWRVATIDPPLQRQGPWGDSQPFRRVEPGPQFTPPALQGPTLSLGWSAQAHARTYRIQLSGDADFGTLLADAQSDVPRYQLQQLPTGSYYVRVLAIGADGFTGPWGEVQSFRVPEPEPPPPPDWRRLLLLIPLLLLAL